MLDAMAVALGEIFTGSHLFHLLAGILVGIVIGILPGLGGTAGMALLLPFVYGMDSGAALAMMIGLLAILATADTFTSVLMGIPGSAGSQATVMDGFPLAQRGEARRALAAAFTASLIGGVLGAVALTGFVQIARPLVLAFGAPELLMLTVFGLSMVGVLSGTNWARGLAACGLGLLIGNIGPAPATGHMRLTFGSAYLSDGLPLVVLALGIFAVPEIIDLLTRRGAIAQHSGFGGNWLTGVRDTLRNWWLVLRSSVIGCIVGAIPGLGGAVVDWIAYGHAVQTAKDKSQFGKGDIRGVIAPESANNAKEGGALVPTLIFGIPGSGATAILLGGFVLIGIQPGPRMITDQLDIVYLIIWSLAFANVIGAAICFALAGTVARLADLRYAIVAPFMISIILFGAFQATRNWGDLIGVLAIGLAALAFKRMGWPRPPLLIGFVLASGSEIYLYQTIQLYGFDWLGRPIVLALIAMTLISVFLGVRTQVNTEASTTNFVVPFKAQILFTILLAGIAVLAIWDAWSIPRISRMFPFYVASAVLLFATLSLFLDWRTRVMKSRRGLSPAELGGNNMIQLALDLRYVLWLVGVLGLIALIGFLPAIALFTLIFLMVEGAMRPLPALALSAAAPAVLYALSQSLIIRFPQGMFSVLFAF
jgi:putative tricarboxylic transport membrane protein